MNKNMISKITIVGGSVTGWTVAAAISSAFYGQNIKIQLIEDGTKDVEAISMLPQLREFHARLGIDERQLIKATHASFKLATIFEDWITDGHQFTQSLGPYGGDIQSVNFHHYASKLQQLNRMTPYFEYSLSACAAKQNKFAHPQNDPKSILSTIDYSLHLDPVRYAEFLKNYAKQHKVVEIIGSVAEVILDEKSGNIEKLKLEDGTQLDSELFIDCTGSRALLIEKALHTSYQSWNDLLPANRRVSNISENTDDIPSFTSITGLDNGWIRRVPFLNTIANELYFNDQEMTDDEASALLLQTTAQASTSETTIQSIHFGQRDEPWHKNCIAFGEAATLCTPLEVSNLHTTQKSVVRFLELFPDCNFNPLHSKQFNRLFHLENNNLLDNALLNFFPCTRKSSMIWKDIDCLPDSFNCKKDLFECNGQIAFYDEETLPERSRASAYIGLGIWPNDYEPLLDTFDFEEVTKRFELLKKAISETVVQMPSHRLFLSKYNQ